MLKGKQYRGKQYRPAMLLLLILPLMVLLTGCPKRPATTIVSAPAPTAAAPAPAPVAAPPAPPAAVASPPAPVPTPAPPKDYMRNAALQGIHFDFDKSAVRPGDAKILDASSSYLKANPEQLVLIEGNCDERGTLEYNLALGERRAKAAQSYLVTQGIPPGRITLVSYGEERPVCTEKTEACWSQNRNDQFLTKPR
jgi:peptidoglycan-associated lipoprotein